MGHRISEGTEKEACKRIPRTDQEGKVSGRTVVMQPFLHPFFVVVSLPYSFILHHLDNMMKSISTPHDGRRKWGSACSSSQGGLVCAKYCSHKKKITVILLHIIEL